MKNERLFGIIYILLSKDRVTAQWLADYFEVSTRTIYRDIDTLSAMNIPIYMSKGKNGGISLLDNYKLDKILLTDEEQKEILFSLDGMNKIKNYDLFEKMKNFFNKNENSWFDVDFEVWGNSQKHENYFELLKQAIIQKNRVQFQYCNSHGKKSERIVEPMKLYFKYNAWYLYSFDVHKNDYRFFKIMRMSELKIINEKFNRKISIINLQYPEISKTIKLVLNIKKEMAYRVYDEFDESNIEVIDNGDFIVRLEFPENDWLYGYILSFGEYLEIIEPLDIRNKIIEKLRNSLNNYL